MKVTFYGAARTVTGSKHLLTTMGGKKILLDCGLYQSKGTEELNHHFGFSPVEVDYVLLSHAHIDHSGALPLLVRQGFSGAIYCTKATYDLCRIMLADSAKIQESDIEYINKKRAQKDQQPIEPLYTQDDVDDCMKLFRYKEKYGEWSTIDDEVEVLYSDAGHILGSACISLKVKEADGKVIHLLFSGDVGRPGDLILRDPDTTPQADYIICESTYGNRLHEPRVNTREKLLKIVTETCVERKGKIIIPAFSLGRTQELVYTLDRMRTEGLLPDIKVYVDSPLSINATGVMRNHPECFNDDILDYMKGDPDPFGFNNLIYIQNVQDSIKLNSMDEPCIIISSSGMMEAGRIKHHIKNNIGDEKNTILIVGFVPANTLGDRLLKGEKTVRIFGEEYDVEAHIEELQAFSAHADYSELIDWLKPQKPAKVKRFFLVHGEFDAQEGFKEKLITLDYKNIEIPERGDSFDLT
jgi:metallo-beta-lactamase family protein